MSLALRMGRTLSELGATMSSAEFSLWVGLYQRSPWDDMRMDFGFAQVCAAIANYAGKVRSAGAPPASPADYMPFLDRAKESAQEEPDPVTYFKQFQR